jgi:hypothetical protein
MGAAGTATSTTTTCQQILDNCIARKIDISGTCKGYDFCITNMKQSQNVKDRASPCIVLHFEFNFQSNQ